jgi:hypothetical protein
MPKMLKKKRGGFTGNGQKYPRRPIVNNHDAGEREAFSLKCRMRSRSQP